MTTPQKDSSVTYSPKAIISKPLADMSKQELNKFAVSLVVKKIRETFQNELVELIINKHSIDLTMISKTVKVYVRSKRGRVWPNLKGINGKNEIMVFVDFSNGIPEVSHS